MDKERKKWARTQILVYIAIFALLLISFILRLWPLQVSHWWDEAVYLQNAEVIYSGRVNYEEFDLRPPLLPMIFAFSYLFKHHIFTSGVMVALLGTIGVFFMYLLGKEAYNETVGIIAALSLGLSPFMVTASHWIMTDSPSMTLIIMALYFLRRASKTQEDYLFFFAGVFFSAAILMRFTSLVLIIVLALYFFVDRTSRRRIKICVLGFALALLPYLIWAQYEYGFFLSPFIKANRAVSDATGGGLFYLSHFIEVYPLLVVIGLLIYAVWECRALISKERFGGNRRIEAQGAQSRMDVILVGWILLFLAYISLVPHKEVRYILPMAPAVYLLSSRGYTFLLSCKNRSVYYGVLFMVIILGVFSFSSSFSRLQEPFINEAVSDPVGVSQYITSLYMEDGVIYANTDYPVYAYYTGMDIKVLRDQDETFYESFASTMDRKGFFVYYKNLKKEPAQEWLDAQKQFTKGLC